MRARETKNVKFKPVWWKTTILQIGEIGKNLLFLTKSEFLAILSIFNSAVFHHTVLNLNFLVSMARILLWYIFSDVWGLHIKRYLTPNLVQNANAQNRG